MNHIHNQHIIIKSNDFSGSQRRFPSATIRQLARPGSGHRRDLFALCSAAVREVFGNCSGFSEAHPKRTRTTLEGVPKKSRSGLEERPKETRTASEEIDSFFHRFSGTLKAGIKYRCSKDIVLFTQLLRKIREVSLKYNFRTSGIQYPYLFSTTTTQQQPKDDPSASLARPSLRTGYRQGSPKVDARKTQETANNDTRNVRLMYCECTVSVLGVYGKGTKEVLRRYWRATKDMLNGCTSGLGMISFCPEEAELQKNNRTTLAWWE